MSLNEMVFQLGNNYKASEFVSKFLKRKIQVAFNVTNFFENFWNIYLFGCVRLYLINYLVIYSQKVSMQHVNFFKLHTILINNVIFTLICLTDFFFFLLKNAFKS